MEGEHLKQLRKELNLSISKAARMVHVSDRTWCRYESGQQKVPDGVVELFCIKNGLTYTQH